MQENQVAVFGVIDPLSTQSNTSLSGKFVNGNKISLSAYKHITSTTQDRPTEYFDKFNVNIYHLQPNFIFDEPILRSLLAEANSTFITLQELKKSANKSGYLKISRTYRSIIRACLEKLQEAESRHLEQSDESSRFQNYVTIFYSIECVWHLCEIFFIDVSPSNLVVPQLLDWIRFHFPSIERMATDLLLLGRDASHDDNYWPTVKGLILQGQVDVARAILQLHPLSENCAFKMTEQILRTMPTFNLCGGFSVQKFRVQWQYWKVDAERKVAADIISIEPNLEEIIGLVIGDTKIWNKQIKESMYWYEYLPGYLFYTEPACKHFELASLANSWINRWISNKGDSQSGSFKYLDKIILNLMENDLYKVIHAIQLICDNQWFVTHLTDLLFHCEKLHINEDQEMNECLKLRDSLLFEFGSCLMSKTSLWQIGMDYLEHCSNEGKAAIEIFLTKIPIHTEKQALKIVGICRQKGLHLAEKEICKVRAKKSFDDERYGNALEWAIRSKDAIFVTSIADFFLNYYSKNGDMIGADVIANIGAKMFISPRLVFLVKYFDFYQFYRRKNFLPAAELLINLLDSKITPEYFWPSLLIDTIPLLESKDPKILAKETCAILNHLESQLVPLIERKKKILDKNPNASINILKDYRIENIEEIISLLRLACARNLSRAIIIENTVVA